MKRRYVQGMMVLSLVFGIGVPASATELFSDTFESYTNYKFPTTQYGTPGGWVQMGTGYNPQSQLVDPGRGYQSTKSLRLVGSYSVFAGAYHAMPWNINQSPVVRVESQVYISTFGLPSSFSPIKAWVDFTTSNGSMSFARVTFNSDGKLYAIRNPADATMNTPIGTFSLSQWYKVAIEANFSTNRFTVWINDELKAERLEMIYPLTALLPTGISVASGYGGGSGISSCPVAYFDNVQVDQLTTLSVVREPSEGGSVTGTGIACDGADTSDCQETYDTIQPVELTAAAYPGYVFDHWEENGVSYAGQTHTVTMDTSKVIQAVFLPLTPPTVHFSDTFESYPGSVPYLFPPTSSGWVLLSDGNIWSSQLVDPTLGYRPFGTSGTKSLRLSGGLYRVARAYHAVTIDEVERFETQVFIDQIATNSEQDVVTVGFYHRTSNTYIGAVVFRNDLQLYAKETIGSATQYTPLGMSYGLLYHWYKVTIDANFTTRTFAVSIDGVRLADNLHMDGTILPTGIAFTVGIGGATSGNYAYSSHGRFDEVVVESLTTLSVSRDPATAGTVTGSGITCDDGTNDCEEHFSTSKVVTLTASPNPGFDFDHWLVNGETISENPLNVAMDESKEVVAVFGALQLSLAVAIDPPQAGSVTGNQSPNIDCGNGNTACSQTYPVGTEVLLTAVANEGWVFHYWDDGTSLYGHETLLVTMSAPKSLKAVFLPTLSGSLPDIEVVLPSQNLNQSEYSFTDRFGHTGGQVGCVPTSYAMMFLHYFNRNNPYNIQLDTSPHSYNTERILITTAEHLDATVGEDGTGAGDEEVESMRSYEVEFQTFSDPPYVSVTWDLESFQPERMCAHHIMGFLKQKIEGGETVILGGSLTNCCVTNGGHFIQIIGYRRVSGAESFLVNDTWDNSSRWATVNVQEENLADGTLKSGIGLQWSFNNDTQDMYVDGIIVNPRVMTILPF